jgi:hypothetical protein
MLTGEAKRAWQREYMRRKRAEQPTRVADETGECWCSFCGTSEGTLVTAPKEAPYPAYICEKCAGDAYYTLVERRRFPSRGGD